MMCPKTYNKKDRTIWLDGEVKHHSRELAKRIGHCLKPYSSRKLNIKMQDETPNYLGCFLVFKSLEPVALPVS